MAEITVRFALYVSAVKGHLVTRFGTDARGLQSFIGAHRVLGNPSEIVWDEETIVPLSEDEATRYRREYQRLLDGKALRRRTEAEFKAQLAARKKAADDAIATAKAATTPKPEPPAPKDPAPKP